MCSFSLWHPVLFNFSIVRIQHLNNHFFSQACCVLQLVKLVIKMKKEGKEFELLVRLLLEWFVLDFIAQTLLTTKAMLRSEEHHKVIYSNYICIWGNLFLLQNMVLPFLIPEFAVFFRYKSSQWSLLRHQNLKKPW